MSQHEQGPFPRCDPGGRRVLRRRCSQLELVDTLKSISMETEQSNEAVLDDPIDLVGVDHWE